MAKAKKIDPLIANMPPLGAPMPNKVQRFEFSSVPRSEVNPAPYNPRAISPEAEVKLRAALEEEAFGLVEPLVWNKRTGHLVGGHQRMRQMDMIHEGLNYMVPVAVVDMPEDDEKELNVLLNNPSVQGRWDLPSLESLFRDEGVDPFNAGFEQPDLEVMFGSAVTSEFVKRFMDDEAEPESLLGDVGGLTDEADEIAAIKEARKNHQSASREDLRSDHTLVIVFDSAQETIDMLRALGFGVDDTFVMAADFFTAVRKRPEVMPRLVGLYTKGTNTETVDATAEVPAADPSGTE